MPMMYLINHYAVSEPKPKAVRRSRGAKRIAMRARGISVAERRTARQAA